MNQNREKIEDFIEEWLPADHAGQKQDVAILSSILLNINDLLNQINRNLNKINNNF